MMPSEYDERAWALVYYSDGGRREPDKYWTNVGKEEYNRCLKPAMKANEDVKDAAANAVADAKTEEEKVVALIRYLRKNLRDLYSRQVTDSERVAILKGLPKDRYRTAGEVLHSGIGDASELNTLFAAMASSLGLEARPALIANREEILFVPAMAEKFFLHKVNMAVNIGANWKLYDVSARLLPANTLSWREEGMAALLSDPKKPSFIQAPIAAPQASAQAVRTAKLNLSEDGSIEGDIDLQYSGHTAEQRRDELEGESESRGLESFKNEMGKRYPDG